MAKKDFDPYKDTTKFTNVLGTPPYILTNDLTQDELRRLYVEKDYWRFYRGDQWRQKRPKGEPENTINYCKAFVNKGVAFLMGKGFTIDVPSPAREITRPILDEVWEDNGKELLGLDIAQAGGITGNSFIKVTIEKFDPEEYPDKSEIYPNGRIRLILLPTFSTFPTWHGHDRDKMVKCRIIYPVYRETELADGSVEKEKVWYKEVITKDTIEEYINDKLVSERENPLNEIPIIRIKNLPLSGSSLGLSDLEDIVPLQKEMNFKATDISDIINYHAGPVTIVKGAKVSGLEKGARKIWGGLPTDADVYNLELESDLKAAIDYFGIIKESMFELGNMPEDAFGGADTRVSNVSGIALHIKNQPLMEQTKVKHKTYGQGIQDINRFILKYAKLIDYPGFKQKEWENLRPIQKYKTSIEFPNPLPKDELVQLQVIAQKIKLMLMSRKDAMIELGEKEPLQKIDEIIKETMKLEKALYNTTDLDEEELEALKTNIAGIVDDSEQILKDDNDEK